MVGEDLEGGPLLGIGGGGLEPGPAVLDGDGLGELVLPRCLGMGERGMRPVIDGLDALENLAPPVQTMLLAGDLEMGHARALLSLEAGQQVLSAHEVVARKLSVRDTEKQVAKALNNGRQAPLLRVRQDKPRDIVRLEEKLADALAAAVEIRVHRKTRRGEQGEIAIAFGSLEELNGLLEKLGARDE